MATCNLTRGFEAYDCIAPNGGIDQVYFLPFKSYVSTTVADYLVSAIDDGGATWMGYKLLEEVGLLESTENKNVQNNSLFYDVNLSFTIENLESAKHKEFDLMARQQMVAIVKTVENTYFLVGDERGAHKTGTNTSSTGTAFGDGQKYTVGFLAKQTHDFYQIDPTVINGLTISFT